MEGRNVLLAIVLSTIVLVVWATFFEAPIVEQPTTEKKIEKNIDTGSPSIDEIETAKKISRNEMLNFIKEFSFF